MTNSRLIVLVSAVFWSLYFSYAGSAKAHDATAFTDCSTHCPEMIGIPAGHFLMGSSSLEKGHLEEEGPQHEVTVRRFAMSRYLITREQYAAFADETHRPAGPCEGHDWRNPGIAQTDRHPVVCVSWYDAKAYVRWLSNKTKQRYRLVTEAEYEYAERGGTTSPYWWGSAAGDACRYANIGDALARKNHPEFTWAVSCTDGYAETSPVGAFPVNPFGLYDATGNVWKWVEDCYHSTYQGAPSDGSAWTSGDCKKRVYRGSGWDNDELYFRSARRYSDVPSFRSWLVGFRVARDLPLNAR